VDKPARILLVDDEPNGSFVFRTALETPLYVFETRDGQAALATLRIDGADSCCSTSGCPAWMRWKCSADSGMTSARAKRRPEGSRIGR